MVDARNFRQALHAFRTGDFGVIEEAPMAFSVGKVKAQSSTPAVAGGGSTSDTSGSSINLPDIDVKASNPYGGLGAAKSAIQSIPKPTGMTGLRTAAQQMPLAAKAQSDTAADDAEGMKAAAAENPDKFNFGSAKGSSKVSAGELQKWRDSTGNATGTLGQYMNARDGKTAVKGGANDQSVIDSKASSTPLPPSRPSNLSSSVPTPPQRPTDLNSITSVPKPGNSMVGMRAVIPKPASVASAAPTNKNDDDDDLDEQKKEKNMSTQLIERFMALHNKSHTNLFEAAKQTPKAKDKPLDTLVKKVNEPKQKLEEGAAAQQMHVHDTKSKDFAVNYIAGSTKEKEPMPKLTKMAPVVRQLEQDKVNSTTKKPAEPMPRLKHMLPFVRTLGSKYTFVGKSVKEESLASALDKLTEEEFEAIEESSKDPNKKWNQIRDSLKTKSGKTELEPKGKEFFGKSKFAKRTPKEVKEHYDSAMEKLNAQEYEALEEAMKNPKNLPGGGGGKFPKADTTPAKVHNKLEKITKNANVPCKEEVEDDLFSEEELAHIAQVLDEEDAPVKRGRGRPKGSKSGSKLGRETGTEDGEVLGYGTKNLQAQIRPGNAPYFKNGTEVKKLVHPDKGTEHEIAMHHIRKFSDDLHDASKPSEKQAIEAAFRKKHMGD